MATKTMKKTISGILAAVLTTASLISLLPAAFADGESTTEYNINQDLDAKQKWKYRNLLPEEGEEVTDVNAAGAVLNHDGNAAAGHGEAHTGTYSWQETLTNEQCIRINIDPVYASQYNLSMWLKTENVTDTSKNTDTDYHLVKVTMNRKHTPVTTDSGTTYTNDEPEIVNPKFSSHAKWEYFTQNVTLDKDTAIDQRCTLKVKSNTTDTSIKLSADDWNFRLIPDWTVNATGVSAANGVAKWTFDKDIDKWTVTKDLFTVTDGVTIDTVTVETDETSRKTTLAVDYSSDSAVGSITLPTGIKDAWGREIENVDTYKTADISTVETTYDSTAASELDAWGKWKYRNLLPSEGEEKTSNTEIGFIGDMNASSTGIATDTDDKKSGNYSWKTTLKPTKTVRFKVDGLVEGNYYWSGWMKTTTDFEYTNNQIPFVLQRNWTNYENTAGNAAGQLQQNFKDPNSTSNEPKFQVKNTWDYVTVTRKHDGGDSAPYTMVKNTEGIWTKKTPESRTSTTILLCCSDLGNDDLGNDYKNKEVTLNFDEVSFRLIPEWNVNFEEKVSVPGENKIRWTFDKDIDPWTCTKDLFVTEGCTVTDVNVATDDKTRVTTLTVTYNVTGANASITLPEGLTDAWGREIQNVETNETFRLTDLDEFDGTSGEFVKVIGADVPADALVFVASYGSDENLLGVTAVTVTGGVARGTAVSATTASSVKLFVWTNDLKPICESIGLR